MKSYNQKRLCNISIVAVTAIIWMGLAGPVSAQINVTSPTSSTIVHDNEDLTINWNQEGVQSVDILLWSGTSPVFYLAQDVTLGTSSGTYYWTVPDHFPEGDGYQILVIEAGNSPVPPEEPYDFSEEFTIVW